MKPSPHLPGRRRCTSELSSLTQLWVTLMVAPCAMLLGLIVGCPLWGQRKELDAVVESVWARNPQAVELTFTVAVLLISVGVFCFVRGLSVLFHGVALPLPNKERKRPMAKSPSSVTAPRAAVTVPAAPGDSDHRGRRALTLTDSLAVAAIESTRTLG